MFDAQSFVAECRAALVEPDVLAALASRVAGVFADREALLEAFGVGSKLRVATLHASADLTILQFVCPIGFAFPIHDHRMRSVVGVYSGVEDNVFYRRQDRTLLEVGRTRVHAGEVAAHDSHVIHSIANLADEPLAAIHVYAGDFFHAERSEWRGAPPEERAYDLDGLRRLVESGRTPPA